MTSEDIKHQLIIIIVSESKPGIYKAATQTIVSESNMACCFDVTQLAGIKSVRLLLRQITVNENNSDGIILQDMPFL